jgi:2-keto-4-pentenoate hydratase/2-oxohepta-3-ene-1,7-dioic acid hydratase in catechol pathway
MKLLYFDDFKLGVMNGDNVVDVTDLVHDLPHFHEGDLIKGVIADWSSFKPKLEERASSGQGAPLSSVRVRSPLPRPTNMICMAVNYMENGTRAEPAPINSFTKSALGIIGDGDTMVLPDVPATIFEGEAELALVISKDAANVPASQAMDYIFGYTQFIDGSARGIGDWFQMKSRATFAPIGPFLVTADEVGDPHNLQVKLWNNGVLKQDYHTSDMAHKIPRCIEFVTATHPLEAGDIIALGTNHRGLHAFQDGDRIEMETEKLGRLTIMVADELKRAWGRETRLERTEAGQQGTAPQTSGKYAKEPQTQT